MSHVARDIEIDASPTEVWAVVADLDFVPGWNPNVVAAECSDGPYGVGTTRSCEFAPSGHIDEVVSAWEPERRLEFEVGRHGGIRHARMAFELTERAAATRVTASSTYELAFGPLGPVMDRLVVQRQLGRMMQRSLDGLKQHVEGTREPSSPAPIEGATE